jgi:hypothetical protein
MLVLQQTPGMLLPFTLKGNEIAPAMSSNHFRFGKQGLILLWDEKRAQLTFLYVLGQTLQALLQPSDAHI